jgi:hypothetical protein
MALSNSSILFADGAEAGVVLELWLPHATNAAADTTITANWFLKVVFMGIGTGCSSLL